MTDIAFRLGDHRVNLRAGAIIRRGPEVLLCRNPKLDLWYTPGGRIRTGEDSRAALSRELQEELGCALELGRLLLVGENFFTFAGDRVHEVCFYHEALYAGQDLRPFAGDGEELHWVAVSNLAALKLVPPFLQEQLVRASPDIHWVSHRD